MADLTKDKLIDVQSVQNAKQVDYPCAAGVLIPAGSNVGLNGTSGARQFQSGDVFAGVAKKKADNSKAGSAKGDVEVTVVSGRIERRAVTGATEGDQGALVYASDGDVLTDTASAGDEAGVIVKHESGTTCLVEMFGPKEWRAEQ